MKKKTKKIILRSLCGTLTFPIFAILILGYSFYMVGRGLVDFIGRMMAYTIDGGWK